MLNTHGAKAILIVLALTLVGCGSDPVRTTVKTVDETTTSTQPAGPTKQEIAYFMSEKKRIETDLWVDAVEKNNFIAWFDYLAEVESARQEQLRKAAEKKAAEREVQVPSANRQSSGRCGGDLPPCCVMNRESGGSLTAQNPSSTASGKWQFLDSTWAGFGGYSSAYLAPESVQDAKARQLWAGGAGASHWGGGC